MHKHLTRAIAVLAVLAVPLYVWATCTYSTATGSRVTIASCNSTTEAAPTLATEGADLTKAKGVVVGVKATGTMTAGGKLNAYLYSAHAGIWFRAPDLDLTAAAQTNQMWLGTEVLVPFGRIDYRPSALGANNTLIYIHGFAP